MISVSKNGLGKEQEVRDDEKGVSRTVYNVEQIQTHGQLAKVVVSCESGEVCCKKDRKIDFSDLVSIRKVEIEMVKGR